MRRIADDAKSFVHFPTLVAGLVSLLLASAALADQPTANEPPAEEPKSGVIIRLQLQPSAPEPAPCSDVEQPTTESDKAAGAPEQPAGAPEQPTTESKQDGEPDKIPATEVKFRRRSKGSGSSRTSREPVELRHSPLVPSRAGSPNPKLRVEPSAGTAQPESSSPEAPSTGSNWLELSPNVVPESSESDGSDGSDETLALEMPDSLQLSDAGSSSKDKAGDLDFSNERPLDSLTEDSELKLEPGDVPLEPVPHPFDAPAAESIAPIIKRPKVEIESFSERERRIEAGIARCLNYYLTHPENTTRRGPWALMHATLPFGVEGEVLAGNRRVNTIGWLSFNGTSGKQHMFQPTRSGFRPNVGPGMQGHEGQFLAILAQSNVRGDYPLQVNGRRYTVMDLARYEMATCREKTELTFKLIGLSRYLEPDQRWRDNRGRPWTVEKMLVEEMAQPINGAACGGVHRLMGLSFAIVERQADGQPLSGNWQRAEQYLNNYVQYTLTLQNSDGSFSTNWFESRGMNPDIERRVQTSGHILEWLVYTLPDDHLRSPRIEQAVEFLLGTVGREPQRDWPIGPRGHALRALALYNQRVFGTEPGQLRSYVAQLPQPASLR